MPVTGEGSEHAAGLGAVGSRAATLTWCAVIGRADATLPQAYLNRRQALASGLLLPGSSVLIGKAQAEAKTVRGFEEMRRRGS